MNEQSMLEDFSLLIPSKNFKCWKGYISLNLHSIYIEISCSNIPQLDGIQVFIPEIEMLNFHQFDLKETVEIIKKKTQSLSEFLKELTSVLVGVWKLDFFSHLQNLSYTSCNEKFYAVIQELNLCGQYVHNIEENIKHITFNVLDISKRDHFITIHLPDEYPINKNQPLYFETMIPPTAMDSLLKINTVFKLFEEFKNIVNELSNFWDVYEEIINSCNVIGSYTYKDVNYRIPIDNHVCVEVEVDPFNPKGCPKFNLHGRQNIIEKFQQRLIQFNPVWIWSMENSFKENVLNVFEITSLPLHYEEDKQELTAECSNSLYCCFICYDQLDTTVKKQTKTCVNVKCDALYHMECICEWLLNSGSTPMFEHLQGKCPQCEEDMLVALENFDLIKT